MHNPALGLAVVPGYDMAHDSQTHRPGAGMSDTDSFIDEVTEEVRRDRMYLLLRRWGWVGVVAVVCLLSILLPNRGSLQHQSCEPVFEKSALSPVQAPPITS